MSTRTPEWTVLVVIAVAVAIVTAVLTWGEPLVPVPFDDQPDRITPQTVCCPVETEVP